MPTVSRGLFRWLLCRGATLEDFADRLNHVWTFGLLIVLACVVSWRHTVERPIHCFPPSQMPGLQAIYMENHCWNSHLIMYPPKDNEDVEYLVLRGPDGMTPLVRFANSDRFADQGQVTLYQWLPLIFCFQALLFKLPNIIMYILHGYSGISFEKISSLTEGYEHLNMADRQLLGRQTGRYIYNWCFQFKCLPWRLLTMVWFTVKVLFLVNVIVQLVTFNEFLYKTNTNLNLSTSYGDVINDNMFENNVTLWRNSLVFPRAVFCDVAITHLQNIQSYTLQCDLPANEFNEKVCMFLWAWFTFVATVTCASLVVWMITTLLPMGRKSFLSKALLQSEDMNPNMMADPNMDSFTSLVGEDGVMALKLVGSNSSDHVVRDAVNTMWALRMTEVRGHHYQPVQGTAAQAELGETRKTY